MHQSETSIQQACFSWVAFKAAQDWRYQLIYAIPNGGYRHKAVAAKLKKEGVKAGIWDVSIDYPSKGFHGAKIEFKSKGGKLTPEQKEMGFLYAKAGYLLCICRSIDQFIHFVETYFDEAN